MQLRAEYLRINEATLRDVNLVSPSLNHSMYDPPPPPLNMSKEGIDII